jgi:hypothetical protein
MEVICQWRSFEKEVALTATVKGLIGQIFGDLEKNYGKQFTSIAFAMITFSREGLNDPELQDLLSLHEGVMTEVCQYSTLHCFPMHVRLRLKCVIKNLIAEKESHCIKWYHRQLWDTASERYAEKKKECHEIMGKYFSNLNDVDMKREKGILDQPLSVSGLSVWHAESVANRRRTVEGYYHLIQGGLLNEAVEEMCSLEFICCSALCGDLLNVLRSMGELVFLSAENLPQKLDHYYRWIRRRATRITTDPRLQTRLTGGEEPGISLAMKDVSLLNRRELEIYGHPLAPITCHSTTDFDDLEMELTGHTEPITAVSWHPCDSKIATGAYDGLIKLWDAETGELLHTLERHSAVQQIKTQIKTLDWNHDGSQIASGSNDWTVRIWDGSTGELLKTLTGQDSGFEYLAWSHDSSRIATCSFRIVKIWDSASGVCLLTRDNTSATIVSWNHDSSKIISASSTYKNSIIIWDSVSGELLKTLEGYGSASWSHDGKKILSGSDNFFNIWDGESFELLKSIPVEFAHCSSYWNHDGSKIAI